MIGDVDTGTVAFDPGRELISSARVEGTPVFDSDGNKLGGVHSLLINKVSGNVAYVIVSHGGFVGIHAAYHTIPWAALDYDVDQAGYVTPLTRDQLSQAPRQKLDDDGRPLDWNAEEIKGYYTNLDWWGL